MQQRSNSKGKPSVGKNRQKFIQHRFSLAVWFVVLAMLAHVSVCHSASWRKPGYHSVPVDLRNIQDNVSLAYSSREGFIYILCGYQIVRFDGNTDLSWDIAPVLGQPYRFVDSPEGHKYVLTHTGNLIEIGTPGIEVLGKVDDDIIRNSPQPLFPFISDTGSVWITGTFPILEFRDGSFIDAQNQYDLPFTESVRLVRFNSNHVFAFGPNSLWMKHADGWKQIDLPTSTTGTMIEITSDISGNIWISRTDGVFVRKQDQWETAGLPRLAPPFVSWHLRNIPGTDEVLAFSSSQKFMIYRKGEWEDISSLIPENCSRIIGIAIDMESNIWISGWPSGLYRLNKSPVSVLEFPVEISSSMVSLLHVSENGRMLLSTRKGLYHISGEGEIDDPVYLPGYPLTLGQAMVQSSRGINWIATNRGLYQIDRNGKPRITKTGLEEKTPLLTIIEDRKQRLWITPTANRVWVRRGEKWESLELPVRDKNAYVMAVTLGPEGSPWFGTWDGTLVRVLDNPLRLDAVPSPIPFQTTVRGLRFDENGDLWIATLGAGIFRRTGETWHHYTMNDDLPSNSFTFIEPFHGRIVAGCEQGILVMNPQNLSYQLLTKPDDLPSTDMDLLCAARRLDNDKLLVATRKGIVKITEESLENPPPQAPRPRLLELSVTRPETNDLVISHHAQLSPGIQRVRFTYSAISFAAPQLVRLQYRLTGITDWASTTERSATFWNLPPGSYTFQLKARNLRGGGWSDPVSASFTILPFFWQTNWFRFLLLLFILLFGILLARLVDRLRHYLKDYRKRNFVGDYRLLSTIGKSGPATIYHASHKRFGSDVALKVVDIHGIGKRSVDRFLREAELAEKSAHPNVVRIYEQGQASDKLYIAMERIAGHTLRHWIEKGPFPLHAAVETGLTLLNIIIHLHGLGITHRDLKPDNIMIRSSQDNQRDRNQLPKKPGDSIVLLDFGISKLLDQPAITQLDVTTGTPLYLPPEAFLGKPDDEGTSDLYAIGVILYEITTGCHPYNFRDESPYHVISKLMYSRPTPVGEHLAHIPSQLDQLIMQMIEPNFETRIKNPRVIQQQLKSICHLI